MIIQKITHYWRQKRRCDRIRRGAGWAVFLLLLVWLAGASPLAAQKKGKIPPVPNLGTLLNQDEGDWLAALADMRRNPARARDKLVQAMRSNLESGNRWRVYHHLSEFGEPEDLPFLIKKLKEVEDPREKQALRGAAMALYRPAPNAEDLAYSIVGFSFVQKNPPQLLQSRNDGKYIVSKEVLEALERRGTNLSVLSSLSALRGRRFEDKDKLAAALEKGLGEEVWNVHGNRLLEQFQLAPARVRAKGLLRVEMRNPRPGPVLVELTFDAWNGRFDPDPAPAYLFIEGEQTGQINVPVQGVWQQSRPLRVDVRLREVNGENVSVYQKLLVDG